MKVLILLACVVAAASAVTVGDDEWSSFKAAHSKNYDSTTEEAFRRKIYQENKKEIEAHNARFERGEVSFQRELNMFADMLSHEIAEQRNGFKMDGLKNKVRSKVFKKTGVSLPSSVDWREKGYVTDVKDQGACGSCWAFSTTGSVEGQLFKKTGKLVPLSEMQLVQCSKQNAGCNGGLMDYAFEYIKENNGIDTEKSYGYNELTRLLGIALPFCSYKAKNSAGTVTGYVDVNQFDEEALMEAVATIGPISIAIDASRPSFSSYKSGIYYDEKCSSTSLDHGVLAVGYGSENGVDYWIVKNSWNAKWGEDGYVRIARNRNNHCGVASQASYPTV